MDQNKDMISESAERGWVDVAIRLALVALIVYWSFFLLRPFIAILIWAAILSVAVYPIYVWLKRVLGGRSTLASFLLTVLALIVILGPVSAIGAALVNNLSSIAIGISGGQRHGAAATTICCGMAVRRQQAVGVLASCFRQSG